MKKEVDEGKAQPSSGVHDRGKDNLKGHHAGVGSKTVKYSKVADAKEAGASAVQRARANHHGGNAVKIMPYIPDGASVPLIPNKKQGHLAIDHLQGGSPKRISHVDD